MAKVHVSNVVVLNNPCTFYSSFQFEITFECIEELKEGKAIVQRKSCILYGCKRYM